MIAIIDYDAGNVRSVENAFKRLDCEVLITRDVLILSQADKVILPGVGEAATAMQSLRRHGLDTVIPQLKMPFLGICLGLQLLCEHSEEGDIDCLGIFDSKVKKFAPIEIVPQMGWNNCSQWKGHLFKGLDPSGDLYFIHSYYAELGQHTSAVCDYILPFSAALAKDNFYATQFHPEKSAALGEKILKNFLAL